MKKHYIYCLKVEDELFYIGYSNRDLQTRLKEHINQALNPNETQLINEGIRGKIDDKRKIILAAIDEGFDLTIEPLLEKPIDVDIDEQYYIDHYSKKMKIPTNKINGSIHYYKELQNKPNINRDTFDQFMDKMWKDQLNFNKRQKPKWDFSGQTKEDFIHKHRHWLNEPL